MGFKVKIVEKGFENLTGYIGAIEFKNGESVSVLSELEASRISASMRVEYIEGKDPNFAARMIDSRDVKADVQPAMKRADEVEAVEPGEELAEPVQSVEPVAEETPAEAAVEFEYPQEMLEQIADEKGIKGLREIAGKFDVKAKSVADLIEGIMTAQEQAKPKAE